MRIQMVYKSLTSNPTGRRPTRRRPPPSRPRLDTLEDRYLLSGVHALFDLGTPAGGPFPSDHRINRVPERRVRNPTGGLTAARPAAVGRLLVPPPAGLPGL